MRSSRWSGDSAYATQADRVPDARPTTPKRRRGGRRRRSMRCRWTCTSRCRTTWSSRRSELQDARRADRPRRAERHARRRSARDQGAGPSVALVGVGQHHPRHLRLPGPPVRDPARRHGPVRRRSTSSTRPRHPHAPAHPGRRSARQRPRHAEAAGDRADEHAAARAGRHPVARSCSTSRSTQLGEGQQISLAQRAQALATGAVAGQLAQSIGNALNLDTFEINTAPENGGGAAGDARPAGRAEPLRQGAAGHRRPEPDELHPRVRAARVAAPADQRAAGLEHAAAAVPARCRAAAPICCSSSATERSAAVSANWNSVTCSYQVTRFTDSPITRSRATRPARARR